ncbi:MAG: hypothetical protein ACFFDD_07070 [Promethearchaeota archaeon]
MPSSNLRESPFRPNAKLMKTDIASIAKILIVSVIVFMFIVPITKDYEPTQVISRYDNPSIISQEDLLYQYSLPGTSTTIVVGEISGYRGFAYVIEAESRLYFVDLIQEVTLDISLPAGDKDGATYLTGYDVDLDGNTEFFLRNFVNSKYYMLMVDIDSATVSEFPIPFNSPAAFGFGIFDSVDTYPDILISNRNNADQFLTLDVRNNSTIGTFNAVNVYTRPVIGRFTSLSQDSIAIVGSADRNITVVEGDGSQVVSISLGASAVVKDIVKFDYLGGLEEIATIDGNGDLIVYSGNTLGVLYSDTVDPLTSYRSYIETGDFNSDTQDDLVVVSEDQQKAYFEDVLLGVPIYEVDGIYVYQSTQFGDVGKMDQDTIDDLAVGTTYGGLGVIRGVDGSFANIEFLVDVSISPASQIISYDCMGNTKDDVVVRILDNVYLIISDTTNPILTPLPIDPAHPTILDDYVTIKVHVDEASFIEYADIWMKLPGSAIWMQPQEEMYASHEEGIYYAFIGNLQPGEYQYYINVQDSYLNTGHIGNVTHPEIFSVAGDFVWKIDKIETDYIHQRYQQSDIGNLSDGSPVIYTIERAKAAIDLTLVKYSSDGSVMDSLTIVDPDAKGFLTFTLFTAMLDGDNIQDIIVLELRDVGGYIFRYHAYHGNTFTLMGSGTIPFPYKSFNYMGVFDDDGDGNEEIFIASDTQPYNVIKMDSDLTWTGVDLPNSGTNGYEVRGFSVTSGFPTGYIGVVRGNIQIDILTTDLVYSHSLDIDLSAYPNMEYAGIDTIYNSTSGENQFVAAFTYWNASDALGRAYIFDSSTTNLNNTPAYQIPQPIQFIYPVDARGDNSDELILKTPGELILTDPGVTLAALWATPVTGAQPLSALIADFDGDRRDEFIMFTDQDEHLTQYSLYNGALEWTVRVGEVYNPLLLGDIDSIPGDEIAAYPFATVTSYSLGVVRNIDTHYVMDVTLEFTMTDVVQTDWFDMNVSILNVYGEPISDASVYMNAQYMTPEGQAIHTFSLYYNWMEQHYWGQTTASWPMGIVNLSISIDHYYYHHYSELYIDAMTVRSHLFVTLAAPPSVNQGDNMNLSATVTDIMGRFVQDATVTMFLAGMGQAATPVGAEYLAYYPEVQLGPGFHEAEAQATHPFGTGLAANAKIINVRLDAATLDLYTDFPSIVQQDELVSAWFNITDQYGVPVSGATVTLVSGPVGFELVESFDPGSYRFNHYANIGIGNQTFELRIERLHIVGLVIQEINFDVYGNLTPNVFYETRVAGGSDFEVSIFVRDKYGPVFLGTSVEIDINGTLYPASHGPIGEPEYIMLVYADFLLGPNNFTIYVNATYAIPWSGIFPIRSFSDAATDAEVFSSEGWTVTQGAQPIIELHFFDWADRPVAGATVTVFVNALSYSLLESSPGVYSATISTAGWLPGPYEYIVSVDHPDAETGEPINGTLTVLGSLEFFIDYNPEKPVQGDLLRIVINVADEYGNPIPELEVYVEFMGLPLMKADPTDQVGEYVATIPAIPSTLGYGEFSVTVTAAGEFVEEAVDTSTMIPIEPATPNFAMSTSSLSFGAGASFVLSLIGMVIYFRMAASLRVDDKSLEGRKKSLKNMDRLYLLIVLGSGAGLIGSYSMYTAGNYAAALILTVALLGCSVLLYGLWLYRDATAAVLVRGSLSRRRMVFGLWHLVFVPLVIFMILLYGVEIDWFRRYIIDVSVTIGDISIPSIMTTIFAAYMSSILVVVVNLYREVGKGLKKIEKMEEAGTPEGIVEDERTSMVSRFGSSVRIKFLMFLVVVGATTVMSLDFLASWELAVIVLLPVAFLVVIPFISSKIIQFFSKISGGKIPTAPADT